MGDRGGRPSQQRACVACTSTPGPHLRTVIPVDHPGRAPHVFPAVAAVSERTRRENEAELMLLTPAEVQDLMTRPPAVPLILQPHLEISV